MPDPSMADPNSLMPMMPAQQQVIPQGPTVQATAPSTNSLADIANLAIPALVGIAGAHSRRQSGLLGGFAGAGAGAEAMTQQRITAQKFKEAQEISQYRELQNRHSQQQIDLADIEKKQTLKTIADEDEMEKTITDPAERAWARRDPAGYTKYQVSKKLLPGEIQAIVNAYPNTYTVEQLSKLPPDTIHTLAGEVLKARLPSKPDLHPIDLGGGKQGYMFMGPDGKPHMVPMPEELNQRPDKPEGSAAATIASKGLPPGVSDKPSFAGPPPKGAVVGGRLSPAQEKQLGDDQTVITQGMNAMDLYDKVLKKNPLWSTANMMSAMTPLGSRDPDIEEFATNLQAITNIKAHERFGARLTATEIQRLARELPSLTMATFNSTSFKTALATTMSLYRTAMAREIAALKSEGKRVPEQMEKMFPLKPDDPYMDPAKFKAHVAEQEKLLNKESTPAEKMDTDTAQLKEQFASQPEAASGYKLPEGWGVKVTQ